MFRIALLITFAFLTSLNALSFSATDFSGTWIFNHEKSKNIGMMSNMKLTTVIEQSAGELMQKIDATMMGQRQQQQVRFDLDGKPVPNETPMGEKSQTVTKWDGPKLISTWKTPGAVPGTTKVSVETRYLSPDKKTMYVESSRTGKAPVVMVYDKK